jgi:purine-nucleoside/S-methyl-5'-thioadenosine phosphorylase / adenosine deaminase
MIEGPFLEGGHWLWRARRGEVEVRFTGRGPAGKREEILQRIEPGGPSLAWAKQIHSAHALPAQPGKCGEGDALFGEDADLALSVVTADCVPVLLAGPEGRLAAVHAGWRGLVAGVIPAAMKAAGGGEGWTAWIGPAIGPCCYEVGEEVAEQVAAAGGPEVVVPGPAGKPHLDLIAAARHQLAALGVGEVHHVAACTKHETERLYSYRREGKGVGRNLAIIWRRSAP